MKLTREQVMVCDEMNEKDVSIRQLAKQLGVRESALRYRLRRRRDGTKDG